MSLPINLGTTPSTPSEDRSICLYCHSTVLTASLEHHFASCPARYSLYKKQETSTPYSSMFLPSSTSTVPVNIPTDVKSVPVTWTTLPPGYKWYPNQVDQLRQAYTVIPSVELYSSLAQNYYMAPTGTFQPQKSTTNTNQPVQLISLYKPTTSAPTNPLPNPTPSPLKPAAKPEEETKWEPLPKLPEAPTFRPTEEEFEDPMKYIMSIREKGKKYGICKIIPPSNKWLQGKPFWKVVNGDKMIFETKVQNIHQLQNRNGPNQKFMDALNAFMEKKGTPIKNVPHLDGAPVDLYRLYQEVRKRGGFHTVNKHKKWKEITLELRYVSPSTQMVAALKNHYQKLLFPYELNDRFPKEKAVSLPVIDDESDDSSDFGYLDGNVFSLNSFKDMANKFRRKWYAPDATPSIQEMENLYWKIVETADEAVQVHYGSDLDVSICGSGFPKDPQSLKNASGWNLNIFAKQKDSLLYYIDENIKGVCQPMLYVGMMFSTFCWHTEDNHLYSINYIHQGAPKSWYGIPAEDAELFESVMKKAMPDLFTQHKDLLYQMVTQYSPRALVEAGVHVYHGVQNEGEFMITFPKGYHAGFNHGFNTAESCNFALEDWFPYGRECLKHYREVGRSSVISIEKLVINACKKKHPAYLNDKLQTELAQIRKDELTLREKAHRDGIWRGLHFDNFEEKNAPLKECCICKYDCYLSAVVCACSPTKVTCINHSMAACNCPTDRKTLLFRYTIGQLDELLKETGVESPEEIDSARENYLQTYIKDQNRFDKVPLPSKTSTTGSGRKHDAPFFRLQRPELRVQGVSKKTWRKLGRKAGFGKVKTVVYTDPSLDTGLFVMESIVDSRQSGKRSMEYLIKWSGFSDTENTWEAASNLCCARLIAQYKQSKKKASQSTRK